MASPVPRAAPVTIATLPSSRSTVASGSPLGAWYRLAPRRRGMPARMRAMFATFLLRTAISALGLWLADQLLAGISFDGTRTLVAAALLLGVANAVVKPLAVVLTLPITLLTLGLFLLVINAAMLGLVAALL